MWARKLLAFIVRAKAVLIACPAWSGMAMHVRAQSPRAGEEIELAREDTGQPAHYRVLRTEVRDGNRILLAWSAPTVFFLAFFVAMKNFQYMLPVAVPLFCAAFLFPAGSETTPDSNVGDFLTRPLTRKIVWIITILMLSSQLVINLVILVLYAIRGR